MLNEPNDDFSFSGLKTSLRYQLEKMSPAEIALRKSQERQLELRRGVVDIA